MEWVSEKPTMSSSTQTFKGVRINLIIYVDSISMIFIPVRVYHRTRRYFDLCNFNDLKVYPSSNVEHKNEYSKNVYFRGILTHSSNGNK